MQWSSAMNDRRYAEAVRGLLDRAGRAHLVDFIDEPAAQALLEAARQADMRLTTNIGRASRHLTADEVAQHGEMNILRTAYAEAQGGAFRYVYESLRVSNYVASGELTEGLLRDFFLFLNSEPALAFFRAMTADDSIVYVDAQLSRYRHGHFLTAHTDDDLDAKRRFAYVLNLTPIWRADWGGLLLFMTPDGHVAEGYTPRWRALNIFKVPQTHAVSTVTPFANAHRYSITGWLRADRPANAVTA